MDLEVAIAVEQQAGAAAAGGAGEDAGPFGREADILAGEQLLRERLGRLSLDMLVVEGDGCVRQPGPPFAGHAGFRWMSMRSRGRALPQAHSCF